MAHELEFVNGVAQMAYVGATPWHGLGQRLEAGATPQEMLEAAGLDWTVRKVPAFAEIGDKKVAVGWSALTRSTDDKIIDVVSNEWNPVQNAEAFQFFDEYCSVGDMEMHTAGSLKNGQIVWALAKIKESFELFKGDQVDSYMLFTNPHRFGQCIDVRFTPIRVVCNNTLTLSLSQNSDRVVKKNHRTVFDAETVKQQLGIASSKLQQYKEMAEFLGAKRYTKKSLANYFNEVFPVLTQKENPNKELSKSAQKALAVIETQPGAEFAEGTFWQAVNAVTYLLDHEIGKTQDTRLQSAWYGQGRSTKLSALEKAMDYAKMA